MKFTKINKCMVFVVLLSCLNLSLSMSDNEDMEQIKSQIEKQEKENKTEEKKFEVKLLDDAKVKDPSPNCVTLYSENDFKGKGLEVCDEMNSVIKMTNSHFKSLKLGPKSVFLSFPKENFEGAANHITKSGNISNVESFYVVKPGSAIFLTKKDATHIFGPLSPFNGSDYEKIYCNESTLIVGFDNANFDGSTKTLECKNSEFTQAELSSVKSIIVKYKFEKTIDSKPKSFFYGMFAAMADEQSLEKCFSKLNFGEFSQNAVEVKKSGDIVDKVMGLVSSSIDSLTKLIDQSGLIQKACTVKKWSFFAMSYLASGLWAKKIAGGRKLRRSWSDFLKNNTPTFFKKFNLDFIKDTMEKINQFFLNWVDYIKKMNIIDCIIAGSNSFMNLSALRYQLMSLFQAVILGPSVFLLITADLFTGFACNINQLKPSINSLQYGFKVTDMNTKMKYFGLFFGYFLSFLGNSPSLANGMNQIRLFSK